MRHNLCPTVHAILVLNLSAMLIVGCLGDSSSSAVGSEPSSKQVGDERRSATLPPGTVLSVEFADHLSSHSSLPGDHFEARVRQEVSVDGVVAVPAGSWVHGTVTEARRPKSVGGRSLLALRFSSVELPSGELVPIAATFARAGKRETPKDAAIIGGSTLGGAVLGEAVDDGDGAVVGAIVGGLAGTAAAVKTKGKPVEVAVGTVVSIELTEPATLEIAAF